MRPLLGLWVSQQIIEKHEGHIRVRSAEGKGTVFSVFLPGVASRAFEDRLAVS